MANYIYEPMQSPELEAAIEQRPALKKLVMEMFYKYGLRVMHYEFKFGAVMTTDGMPYCAVRTDINDGECEYRYYSKHQKKRGSNDVDRRTYRSVKLSSLMKTLDKEEAVNTEWADVFCPYNILWFKEYIQKSIESGGSTTHGLTNDTVYRLLGAYFDGRLMSEDIKIKCKEELDRLDQAVDIGRQRAKLGYDAVTNPFIVIGANDHLDGYMLCRMRVKPEVEGKLPEYMEASHIEIIEPWRRVRNLEDCEFYGEIAAPLTMLKVRMETTEQRVCKGLPVMDGAHPTGAASYYSDWIDRIFGATWLMIPSVDF